MATHVRTSMRTRRSKRPLSPGGASSVSVDDKRKKKIELPGPPDALVDVVTVTRDNATNLVLKSKPPVVPRPQPALISTDKPTALPDPTSDKLQTVPESIVIAPTAGSDLSTVIQPEFTGPCFKDPHFLHSSRGGTSAGKKSRVLKTLKQITAAERLLPCRPGDPTYSSLEAPPSFKPAKKYSDLSGFHANYTDPHTKLRYATTEEFSRLRMLPQDIVTGLLALRKANTYLL